MNNELNDARTWLLCEELSLILDYEISNGNSIEPIREEVCFVTPAEIDKAVFLRNRLRPLDYLGCTADRVVQFIEKMDRKCPAQLYTKSNKWRQAIVCPVDISLIRDELCEDLKVLYDYETMKGNTVERVDRWGLEKDCFVVVVFAKPVFADESFSTYKKPDSLSRYVNTDCHYPLETSYYRVSFNFVN